MVSRRKRGTKARCEFPFSIAHEGPYLVVVRLSYKQIGDLICISVGNQDHVRVRLGDWQVQFLWPIKGACSFSKKQPNFVGIVVRYREIDFLVPVEISGST